MLRKNNILRIFVLLTLLNIMYGFWVSDFYIFLLRQGFIALIIVIRFFFSDELEKISNEDIFIREILEKKYPILKLERLLAWALIPSLFISVQMSFYRYPFLCEIAYLICLSYFFLVLYSIFVIFKTPELKPFYNIPKSIKINGFRSFSTTSKAFHVCKLCFKTIMVTGVGVYVGPKSIYGPDYRSNFISNLTYPFNGFKTNSEVDLSLARYLVDLYPDDKELITSSDKVTIDRKKLYDQIKERSLPPVFKWFV